MLGLATKIGLVAILLCLWTDVCEADPSKDEGEKDGLASIKKELAEQKKQLAEQKSDFSKQLAEQKSDFSKQFAEQKSDYKRLKSEKTDLTKQLKKLQEDLAKEKISASKLRKADKELLQAELDLRQADEEERAENKALHAKITTKRQEDEKRELDVVSEMKRLLRAEIKSDDTKKIIEEEIETYLNTHSVCQMGEKKLYNANTKNGIASTENITFAQPFPKKPKVQTAIQFIRWLKSEGSIADAWVIPEEATKTGIQFRMGSDFSGFQYVNAMWIACL